jgi:Carboxypeptidase regulatory-like domain/TonB-dependent Receptor Plug Domain
VKVNRKHSVVLRKLACAISVASLALLFSICLPRQVQAQDTGYISGTVTDASGAAVVGAQISLTSTNGLNRATVTDSAGAYVLAALPGGTYDMTVTAQGFQKFTATKIVLNVAQKVRIDVPMKVGAVTEQVVVTGENVAQVETQSSEIGSTITGKQINQLELNGRNFSQLVTLAPGVVSQTGQDEGAVGVNGSVLYSVNGGRTEYNNWEIDGGDIMDNGSNGTLNVYPNPEAIAEVKVLTSNYGAQYGRNASGTVEVETKSGTDTFHGSAFEYLRNDMFNAEPWFNAGQGLGKPAYKKHDFGYTIGGPVIIPGIYHPAKKRTFFFWSQEWRRERDPASISQNVPSDAERGGNFNDVCPAYTGATFTIANFPDCPYSAIDSTGTFGTPFANNTITPTATGTALLQLIPHANGSNGSYVSGQSAGQPLPAYVNSASFPTTWREELVRIDHNLTDSQRLTFRYIHDSWQTVTQMPLWSAYTSSFDNINTNFAGPGTSFVARLTSTFTPSLLNEFVASYTADHILLSNTGPIALPSGFAMGSLYNNNFGGKIPAISIDQGYVYGGGFGADSGYMPWKNANPTYTYRDNITKIVGNHTLQFGAYFVAAQKNQENSVDVQGQLAFDTSSPLTSGNAFADMLLGNIYSYTQNNRQTIFYDRYKILEPYFQDDWRMTRKFTLNLGLRWSFFGRYQERYNQEYGFSPATYNPANAPIIDPNTGAFETNSSGQIIGDPFNGFIQCGANGAPTGCLQNKWMNPAPRFGFAWDPRGDGKWAVRGGYGIFFDHTNGNEANAESLQQGASPLILSATQYNIAGYNNVGAGGGLFFPVSPYSIPSKAQWPYVQQYNLDVEHELPSHILLTVAYVGSKGTHLTNQLDLNQLQPTPASQNPFTPGEAMTGADCTSFSNNGTLANGTPVTGQAAINMGVACGNDPTTLRPYYGYGTITRIESRANSIYNALQVSARRTIGALSFSVAYTYSHSIDDSSDRYDALFVNSYNLAASRAASNFDMRHNLAISYVYAFPFFKGEGLKHTLLGGWQASGITVVQTGLPFTVTNGTAYTDTAGVGNGIGTGSFADLVGNPNNITSADKAAFAASGTFGNLAYSPSAFAIPTGLTFGNVGRNTLRLPGRTNFDFGLFKRFAFKERYAFEFRWENFNLFNHTQFNTIDGSSSSGGAGAVSALGSGTFLVLNGTHDPRIMQFGLRFQF